MNNLKHRFHNSSPHLKESGILVGSHVKNVDRVRQGGYTPKFDNVNPRPNIRVPCWNSPYIYNSPA